MLGHSGLFPVTPHSSPSPLLPSQYLPFRQPEVFASTVEPTISVRLGLG